MANVPTPKQQEVVSQKGALVGDEAVQKNRVEVEPEVNTDAVKAQVAPERDKAPAKVPVHEVYVATDEVITDPSAPEAVQVPDAGRGTLDLPIHQLAKGTVEDQLKDAKDEDAPSTVRPNEADNK